MSAPTHARQSGAIEDDAEELFFEKAPIRPDKQNFALIIALAPKDHGTTGQYAKQLACNIVGCFETVEEAKKCAAENQRSGFKQFDMHIVSMNCFAPFPPPKHTTDVNYCQDVLSEIFEGHRAEANAASKLLDERVAVDRRAEKALAKKTQKARKKHNDAHASDAPEGPPVTDEADKRQEALKTTTKHAALQAKLRDAKFRAQSRRMTLNQKKRARMKQLFASAVDRSMAPPAPEATGSSSSPGPSGIVAPTLEELHTMTPEEKEQARIAFEASLPKPGENKVGIRVGKPQLTPPANATLMAAN